jgi:manganese/zinc/iron transport system substrate-binding protein
MKKSFALKLFAGVLFLSGCTEKEEVGKTDGRLVATTGMIADVAREICGDRVEVVNLIGEGIDPHTFQPGKSAVSDLQKAGLVLYNGIFLEGKMGTILEKRRDKGHDTFAVAEGLEGVELIGGDEHPDPHLWMDVSLWTKVAEQIVTRLEAFAPDHIDHFRENFTAYRKELAELDQYAREAFATIPEGQRVLVTAHDAFSYLGRAYGIEVRGVQGISTESNPGSKDINDLADYLVEKKIPAIFVESSVSEKDVQAVIQGAAEQGHTVKIGGKLFSDAMGQPGRYEGTYLGMMDHNITTIVNALGGSAPARGFRNKLAQ